MPKNSPRQHRVALKIPSTFKHFQGSQPSHMTDSCQYPQSQF